MGNQGLHSQREQVDADKQKQARLKRNLKAINDYITVVRAKLEKRTAGSYVNLEELAATSNKPDSRPPVNDRPLELALHSDNYHAARRIDPAIDWLATHNGVAHYVVRLVLDDPTAPARWENEEDEFDGARLSAWRNALKLLRRRVEEMEPGVELAVAYDPDDEPAANRTEHRDIGRRYDRDDAYRDLSKLVDKRTARGVPVERAIEEVAHNNDVSTRKVKYARAFVRDEAS